MDGCMTVLSGRPVEEVQVESCSSGTPSLVALRSGCSLQRLTFCLMINLASGGQPIIHSSSPHTLWQLAFPPPPLVGT